jgi:hypothetical protein
MIINITRKTPIKEVQQKFNIAFPFLKIEFSAEPYQGEEENDDLFCVPGGKLFEVARKKQTGWVILQIQQTAGQLQKLFEDRFGVYASIFRKENDRWIKLTGTDAKTLEEQNRVGRNSIERNRDPYWREREVLL